MQRVAGNQAGLPENQAKLKMGSVNDQYEREADKVAQSLVSQLKPTKANKGQTAIQAKAQVISLPTLVLGGESSLQPSRGQDYITESSMQPRISRSSGGGSPLPQEMRENMESQLGADLSGVRVHSNQDAGRINYELQARAFTTGHDIYMSAGSYSPHSTEGQRLLAHEITHVVQQGGGTSVISAAPGMVQCWPWSKNKQEDKKKGNEPPKAGQDPEAYQQWLKANPGKLSSKEKQLMGIKDQTFTMSDQQMDDFAEKRKLEQAKELEALGTGKGQQENPHGTDEAGDLASMNDDPRLKARYQVDRKSDHGNWFARKLKAGKESIQDKFTQAKSYLPGQHSVVPGEDYAQQSESKGQKAKRIAKSVSKFGGKKLLSKVPLVGSGMKIGTAVKEGQRQKKTEEIGKEAQRHKAPGSMLNPFLSSMSQGLTEGHFRKKVSKGIEGGIGMVGDIASLATAGISQFGSTALEATVEHSVKPIISGTLKGAKAGLKIGDLAGDAMMDDRKYRLQANDFKKDREKSRALGSLAQEDPKYAQAMLKHLSSGQMSIGHELYTNTRLQEPKEDHTLKPSEVAKLGRQEKARLRERERMGAQRTWSLEGQKLKEKKEQEAQKALKKSGVLPLDSDIPEAPPMPQEVLQPQVEEQENLLGRLLETEEKSWWE